MQYIKQHPIKIEYSKKYDKEDNLINIGNIIAELISVKTVKYVWKLVDRVLKGCGWKLVHTRDIHRIHIILSSIS